MTQLQEPEIIKKQIISLPDGRLDSENASRYIGLTVKTMAIMRCKGTGPTFIKRGKIFYQKDKLDEWLKKGERTQTEPRKKRKAHAKVS